MPINVYTGLMRSGKSYEVVSEVIVPAIRNGRRVVTNVDGISEQRIHEYLFGTHPQDDPTKYGSVLHVTNEQVFLDKFFPYYDDAKDAHVDTVVQPGDLVAVDEAWRFWGTDAKIHKNHKSFFLEHGHFTHDVTKVACDLVLMIQDMGTLHRFVKNVVAFSFRTHKKVALGMNNTYSLNMWEGNKLTKAAKIGTWTRSYKKEIFPLYSSFKGGAQGVMVDADKRQNIFTNRNLWWMLLLLVFGGLTCGYNAWKFFRPAPKVVQVGVAASDQKGQSPPAGPVAASSVQSRPVSESWRVVGSFAARGVAWVVVANSAGVVRLESPSNFANNGLVQVGDIDGQKVTSFSGQAQRPSLFPSAGRPSGEGVAK